MYTAREIHRYKFRYLFFRSPLMPFYACRLKDLTISCLELATQKPRVCIFSQIAAGMTYRALERTKVPAEEVTSSRMGVFIGERAMNKNKETKTTKNFSGLSSLARQNCFGVCEWFQLWSTSNCVLQVPARKLSLSLTCLLRIPQGDLWDQ